MLMLSFTFWIISCYKKRLYYLDWVWLAPVPESEKNMLWNWRDAELELLWMILEALAMAPVPVIYLDGPTCIIYEYLESMLRWTEYTATSGGDRWKKGPGSGTMITMFPPRYAILVFQPMNLSICLPALFRISRPRIFTVLKTPPLLRATCNLC